MSERGVGTSAPPLAARTPAYQVLAEDLRTEITSGRLRPGDRLPTEPQLGVRSGVSRSTVREALRLLASQHLIVTTRGVTGGSFVAHPSPDKLADTLSTGVHMLLHTATVSLSDLLDVREMLEVPAAGLAALRRTDGHVEALRATLFDPADADLDRRFDAHRLFHHIIAAACGNPLVEVLAEPLYRVTNERELTEDAPADFWPRVVDEHIEILRCVTARDGAGACAAARAHLAHLRCALGATPTT